MVSVLHLEEHDAYCACAPQSSSYIGPLLFTFTCRTVNIYSHKYSSCPMPNTRCSMVPGVIVPSIKAQATSCPRSRFVISRSKARLSPKQGYTQSQEYKCPPDTWYPVSPVGSSASRDGGKIDFFNFLSIRPVLSIIDKKFCLSIKNRFCPRNRTAKKRKKPFD